MFSRNQDNPRSTNCWFGTEQKLGGREKKSKERASGRGESVSKWVRNQYCQRCGKQWHNPRWGAIGCSGRRTYLWTQRYLVIYCKQSGYYDANSTRSLVKHITYWRRLWGNCRMGLDSQIRSGWWDTGTALMSKSVGNLRWPWQRKPPGDSQTPREGCQQPLGGRMAVWADLTLEGGGDSSWRPDIYSKT